MVGKGEREWWQLLQIHLSLIINTSVAELLMFLFATLMVINNNSISSQGC